MYVCMYVCRNVRDSQQKAGICLCLISPACDKRFTLFSTFESQDLVIRPQQGMKTDIVVVGDLHSVRSIMASIFNQDALLVGGGKAIFFGRHFFTFFYLFGDMVIILWFVLLSRRSLVISVKRQHCC